MVKVTLGPIVKHKDGIGFKLTYPTIEMANKHKDMMRWILLDEGYKVVSKTGYHDMEEYTQ